MKLKEIKNSPFVAPVKKYYLGKFRHGAPYFSPRGFHSTIFSFRKLKLTPQEDLDKMVNDFIRKAKKFSNLPRYNRSKEWIFKLFGNHYWFSMGSPIKIARTELGYKGKFNSPRFEWSPSFMIFFFKWQFCIHWNAPFKDDDLYWEMLLWYMYYSDKDIKKAKDTWGWVDYNTKKSTWNEDFLKKVNNWMK